MKENKHLQNEEEQGLDVAAEPDVALDYSIVPVKTRVLPRSSVLM
jgi:hypothetical protein